MLFHFSHSVYNKTQNILKGMNAMNRYEHLLSPIRLRGMILKNRLWSGNSLPHYLQGPETFPSEAVINHVVRMAKNGAAVVTFADWTAPDQRQRQGDAPHFPMYDINDPSVHNYLCQLSDQVHYYNSRLSIAMMPFNYDDNYDVSYIPANPAAAPGAGSEDPLINDNAGTPILNFREKQEMTHEQIRQLIETTAQRIYFYKTMGFDLCTLHFSYNLTLFGRFISPKSNHRTDKYGGSIANRCRFLQEMCVRIRELCGQDFPIEVQISGQEEGGNTIDDLVEMAKCLEGYVDVFQFRDGSADISHPIGYNSKEHEYVTLAYSEAVKKAGVKILCNPIGGYQMPDEADAMIAEGKADFMGAARAFFCDFDYYKKLLEGRGEDITPCVRCNKCHVPSLTDTWLSFCTVNPEMGIAEKLGLLTEPAGAIKRVAIIGGGPAGMRAAIYAAQRGHKVTLFEKSDYLGGQLRHADYYAFKWPLRRYRLWLIAQMEKAGVQLRLNTEATKESIRAEGFDAVIVAIGAQPQLPPVKGAEHAITHFDVWGSEETLGQRIVVVGGSESGCETGIYLAEQGHDVTLLTRSKVLAPDMTPIHYRQDFTNYHHRVEKFHYIKQVTTTEIGDGYVCYTDQNGEAHRIECDTVVALGGMKALQDEAVSFYGCAPLFYMIGDCREVGDVQKCNRSAYFASHQF